MLCRSFQLFGEHAEDHQQLERGFAQVHPCASDTNHKCRVSQMCVRWCQLAPWIICSFPFWSDMSLSKIDQNRDTPENPTLWSSWFNGEPTDLGYTVFWQTHNTRDTNTWNVSTTRWCMVWDGCVGFNKFDLVNRSKSVGAWSYGWLFLPLGSCMTLQDFTSVQLISVDLKLAVVKLRNCPDPWLRNQQRRSLSLWLPTCRPRTFPVGGVWGPGQELDWLGLTWTK